MSALLSARGVSSGYNRATVLTKVSLHVERGESVAVVGGNGAGKTTLIRTLVGMVRATAGEVEFAGHDVTHWSTDRICELGLAQIPEGRQVFFELEVEDNLRLGAILKRAYRDTARNLERVYALFPKLKERRRQLAGTLSGGEQQMLAIGRALMSNPELVMLDEPSLGLAPVLVQQMFEIVAQLNREGISILLVEQNVAESLSLCQRGYVLENGEVVLSGTGAELLGQDRVRQAYLGL
jgi:branched-chain amino acid transport system ATP-binding protein